MAEGLEGLLTGHTLVKRYKIEEVIGRGGFAVVYRATDGRLGRPVAVKVITLTAEDPAEREMLRQRLHKEAQAAASLPHHPNLVTVHDVGTDPELGLDFLVMEMLRGENLAQSFTRSGRPPLERALCILRDTGEGLAVGHRAGLVHRDVKPGNIFLAQGHDDDPESFRVCVLDYGIAQAIEDDQTVTRGMGANPLSPAFASPEQLRGSRELTAATDVFSLGVVGYQLLTGERPFTTEPGQAPTGWTVRKPITDLNPDVPLAVEAVVMRAMSEDPRERFPDADAFVDALEVATREDDITQVLAARVAAPGISAVALDDGIDVVEDDATIVAPAPRPAAAAVPHARPVPPLRMPAPARKRSSKMPIVLVLALLLVAAAAWAAMSGRGGGGDGDADALRPSAQGDSVVLDEAGQPVEETVVDRGDPTSEQPIESTDLDPGGAGSGGDPSPSQPSQPRPSPGGVPAVITPNQPNPQPQQPQPPAQQPQRPAPPSAQPPAQQPQQPSRPPAQQPQQPNPPAQQPTPPPAQPQQPAQPQPQPQRPDPPLLGRPVEPSPPPPRDTLFIPATPPR